MDPILIGLFFFTGLIILLLSGISIAIGLGIVGLVTLLILGHGATLIAYTPWVTSNSFILTAIPLFVFMGEILLHSGISEKIYRGASKYLAWAPGGLLHSNIGACSLFAAISGSSAATAVTIGTVALPELKRRDYSERLSLGSLAAGGTLGVLIPPSITMIVYGAIAEVSVGRLFAGGIIPGVILSLMFMIYIGIRAVRNPKLAPKEKAFSSKDLLLGFADLWPIFIIMSIVLGSIFTGFATPTEAAALGASGAIFIAIGYRRLTWHTLWLSLVNAVTTTCMVMFIVIGATMVGSVLSLAGTAEALGLFIAGLEMSPVGILIIVSLIYILLGCVMEGLSIVVVTTPVVLPAVVAIGFDPVWFGVLLVVLTETGMLTPPVGIILFIVQGMAASKLDEVVMGAMPFFLILVLGLLLFIVFPSLVLWIPSLIFSS
ncbi:MAG: TRAP transporter large permease subunit [Chloroflexota bacterium]|nr:MAG: TRAP transporter large permease subunit [Chloroflexota bacterium]